MPTTESKPLLTSDDSAWITPALPTCWCSDDVDPNLLANACQSDSELEKVYHDALRAEAVQIPTRVYGRSQLQMPVLTLGGTPFLYGNPFITQRPLWGWCPPFPFLVLNLIVVPLTIAVCAATGVFSELTTVRVVVALAGPPCWLLAAGLILIPEQKAHGYRMLSRCVQAGMIHIETARHYLTSEAFLGAAIKRLKAERGDSNVLIQTKVRPYSDAGAFTQTLHSCLNTLCLDSVDLLAVHGVNLPEHADTSINTIFPAANELKRQGKTKAVGFSFHAATADAIRVIESGEADFVNLHFNFFGSYTNVNNSRAIEAAAKQGMGVMCISPVGQAGDLHKPSDELVRLCHPLHPIELNILFILTYPGVHTCSTAPPATGEMVRQLNVIKLLPVAHRLLPPIIHRLRKHAQGKLGTDFSKTWATGVDKLTQGGGDPPPPGHMNVAILLLCFCLHEAFEMTSFAKRMHNNLSWPGDWCCGSNTAALGYGTDEDGAVSALKASLTAAGSPFVDRVVEMLRSFQKLAAPTAPARPSVVMGILQAYVMRWMEICTHIAGFRQSKEYGSMPKTAN